VEVRDQSDLEISDALRRIAGVLENRERWQGDAVNGLQRRRLVAAQRLLEGTSSDAGSLNYSLTGFHLGLVIAGQKVPSTSQMLGERVNARLLLVEASEGVHWLWLGGSRPVVLASLSCLLDLTWPPDIAIAYGDPSDGLDGWRLSHRQAAAALPLAQQGPKHFVRYTSVALLVTALHDDLLASSLRQTYLVPLEVGPDSGRIAKSTLRAYFEASRQATSAASALGVNRATVGNRLQAIEQRLGTTINSISAELEVALRLDEAAAHRQTRQSVGVSEHSSEHRT
jgi:hypothetical protein